MADLPSGLSGPTRRLDRPWLAVDPGLGETLRAGLAEVIESVIEAVTAEVPAYARPEDAAMQRVLRAGVRVALERLIELLGTGDEPAAPPPGCVSGSVPLSTGRIVR